MNLYCYDRSLQIFLTFLCSETSILSCTSISLLVTAASIVEAHRGGKGGTEDAAPGGHIDFIASPLMGFHLDSSCRSNTHSSTASEGWQFPKNFWWLKIQPIVRYGYSGLGCSTRGGSSGLIGLWMYLVKKIQFLINTTYFNIPQYILFLYSFYSPMSC